MVRRHSTTAMDTEVVCPKLSFVELFDNELVQSINEDTTTVSVSIKSHQLVARVLNFGVLNVIAEPGFSDANNIRTVNISR